MGNPLPSATLSTKTPSVMKVLLIEDEPAAVTILQQMLEVGHPDLTVAGVAYNVIDGLRLIAEQRPDLIFLDINFPVGTGFDLVRALSPGQRPEIIFVTSEDQYAHQAIRVAALGYILKPVDAGELAAAIELAQLRLRQKNSEQRLSALLENIDNRDQPEEKRVGIPSEGGVKFVRAGDIIYCEGVEGYTRIHLTDERPYLSSYSVGEYRRILDEQNFYPVHRSFIVNRGHVRSYTNGGEVSMTDGTTITISRRRRAAVLDWLNQ